MRHRCEPRCGFFPLWLQFLLHTSCTHQHTNIWHSLSRNFIFWPLCEKSTWPVHWILRLRVIFFPRPAVWLCDQRASHLSRRPAAAAFCSLSILSDRTFNCPERKNWCRRIYYTMPYTNRKTGLNYCDCREGDYKTHAAQLMSQKSLLYTILRCGLVIFLSSAREAHAAAALWCEVFALRKYCYYVNTSARLSLVKHWK